MVLAIILLLGLAPTARAQQWGEPGYVEDIWLDRIHYDMPATVTAGEIAVADELRGELSRWVAELNLDCERAFEAAGADPTQRQAVFDELRGRVIAVHTARDGVIASVERMFPTKARSQLVADALMLLMQLHTDHSVTQARIDQMTVDAPCEPPEIMGAGAYGYYAASAGGALVRHFPDDKRRVDVQRALVELYTDLSWPEESVRHLRDLLCPGTGDAALEAQYGAIDDSLGANVYGGSTVDYASCVPVPGFDPDEEVDAWLRLAEHEDAQPGRRAAAIKALERAIAVDDATPRAAAHWELGDALRRGGRLVDAIPELDDAAELGFRDAMDVEVGREAVAAIGATLAALWRESSLPEPDAALKLARIYFHTGRRRQPHVRQVFVELAAALRQLGAYEQAASVQREVVDGWADHASAPAAAQALVEIELERGDRDAADATRERMIAAYGAGSAWARAHGAAGDVLVDDARIALARSRFVASRLASEAGAGVDAAAHVRARAALEDVIASSNDPARVLEARYLVAHTLAYQHEFLPAARLLRDVVATLPADARERATAIQKMVSAYEQAAEHAIEDGSLVLPEPAIGPDTVAVELPAMIAELRVAYDLLLGVLDRPNDVAQILMAAARVDQAYGRLDDAEAGLRRVLADHCFTSRAAAARDQLVPLVTARRGEAAAQAIIDDVTARGCLDTAKAVAAREKAIEKLLVRARELQGRGDHAAAVRLLAREHGSVPATSAVFDDLLVALGQAYEQAGALDDAASVWDELASHPELARSPLWVDMLERRAAVLARQLDWPRAASAYLDAAAAATATDRKKKGGARADAAVWAAASLRDLDHAWLDRGDEAGAVTLYLRVARGGGERARDAWLAAAAVARRAGKRDVLAAIVAEWHKTRGARDDREFAILLESDLAAAADTAGDRKAADTRYREVVRLAGDQELTPRAADALATARFWLADEAIRTDTAIKSFRWGGDRKEDDERLAALTTRLDELSSPLRTLQYGSTRYAAAATVRIVDVWLMVIEAIVTSPPPEWVIAELKLDRGAADYAAQIRKLMIGSLQMVAGELTRTLRDGERAPGSERWFHEAEDRLAQISVWLPTPGGARREAWMEGLE